MASEILEIRPKEIYWVPHPAKVWVSVMVQEIYDESCWVRCTDDGTELELDIYECPFLPVNPRVVDDMTSLHYLHEPGIMYNLEVRAQVGNQRPYTYVANVLVAVNPLRKVPDPPIESYRNTAISSNQPHPYGIAELAYKQLSLPRAANRNQSIVISGESGAGKTETAKIVLRYLCWRAARNDQHNFMAAANAVAAMGGASTVPLAATSLDKKLLQSNPILEAFGNAKTLRNDNSSRFGKFMKLQFDENHNFRLVAAGIETYLLEKSRVVSVADGERNYHVFYQLLAGASPKQLKQWRLHEAERYAYLSSTFCYEVEDRDDAADFDVLSNALKEIGVNSVEYDVLFRVLSGVLHLGNLEFGALDLQGGEAAVIEETHTLDLAAEQLGVTQHALEELLCMRELQTVGAGRRGSTYKIPRDITQATYARDAVAKAIYSQVFDWLVHRIGRSLNQGAPSLPFIGVLDIFGFESFDSNSLEQLLINFANETLQQTFNKAVLIAEQRLYQDEGLVVEQVEFASNTECVELITGSHGILSILDATCKAPNPSEEKFLQQLHQTHKSNSYFPRPHPKDMQDTFIVKHYAKPVKYQIGTFIPKNMDTLPHELSTMLICSTHTAKCDIFTFHDSLAVIEEASPTDSPTTRGRANAVDVGARQKGRRALDSISVKFSKQMANLCHLLEGTNCNFIRCIKPNPTMTTGMFDNRYVVDQLRSLGIVQTCEVLKVGMPTRVEFAQVEEMYRPLLPPRAANLLRHQTARGFTEAVLWAFSVPRDAIQLGVTRVFFQTGKIALLDDLLKVDMNGESGQWLTKRLTLWITRRWWRTAIAKVLAQLQFIRLFKYVQRRRLAATKLQATWRMFVQSGKLKQRKIVRRRWRVAVRKIMAQQVFLQDYLLIKQAREMRLKAEQEAEEQARREAEEEARKAREAQKRPSLMMQSQVANDMRTAAAASVLATVSVSLFRWQRVKYFRAFEKWLEAVSDDDFINPLDRMISRRGDMLSDEYEYEIEVAENCYECDDRQAVVWCQQCSQVYCKTCSAFAHNSCKVMREHGPVHISLRPRKDSRQTGHEEHKHENAASEPKTVGADAPPATHKQKVSLSRVAIPDQPESHAAAARRAPSPRARRLSRPNVSFRNPDDRRPTHARNESLFNKLVDSQNTAAEEKPDIAPYLGRSRAMSTAARPRRRGTIAYPGPITLGGGSSPRPSISLAPGAPRLEAVEVCGIKSCKQPATKGVSIRFCDVHYEEFRNHMKGNEETEERKTLQNQVALLKRQLAAAGQQPVEFVELHVAREKMQAAVQRLMTGDETAEKEIERWDAAIRMNPDYQKEQEEKAKKWEEDQRPKNEQCLRLMRTLVPPDIAQCNLESLSSRMPKALAQRMWSKKALWLVRTHVEDIKRVHIADLRAKYGNQGLDIIEMRAIWICLPAEFENDGDGKKAEWLGFFRQKLEELTTKEEANRLNKSEQRNPAYKGCDDLALYDPDAPIIRLATLKSTAFAPTEQPALEGIAVSIKDRQKNLGITEQPAAASLLQVNFNGDWERKYCVLKCKSLSCYPSDSEYAAEAPADVTREITRSTVVMDIKEEGQDFVIELDCDGNKLKLSALSDDDKGIWKSAIQDIIRARISAAVTAVESPPPTSPAVNDDPGRRSTLAKDTRAGLLSALTKQGPTAGGGGGERGGLLAAIQRKNKSGSGADSGSDARDSSSGGRGGLLAAIAKRGSASGGDRNSTAEKPESGARGGLLAAIQGRKSAAARDSTSEARGSGAAAPAGARGGLLAAIQGRNKGGES